MEDPIISGVAHDRSEAKITVVGVPDVPGTAARIFEVVAGSGVNIDMIVQNVSAARTGLTDISFSLPEGDGPAAMSALSALQGEIGFDSLQFDVQVGRVLRQPRGNVVRDLFGGAIIGRRHQAQSVHVAFGPKGGVANQKIAGVDRNGGRQ